MSLKTNYRDGDSFTKKSKQDGYRSRASYKLKEILEKEVTIKKGPVSYTHLTLPTKA